MQNAFHISIMLVYTNQKQYTREYASPVLTYKMYMLRGKVFPVKNSLQLLRTPLYAPKNYTEKTNAKLLKRFMAVWKAF